MVLGLMEVGFSAPEDKETQFNNFFVPSPPEMLQLMELFSPVPPEKRTGFAAGFAEFLIFLQYIYVETSSSKGVCDGMGLVVSPRVMDLKMAACLDMLSSTKQDRMYMLDFVVFIKTGLSVQSLALMNVLLSSLQRVSYFLKFVLAAPLTMMLCVASLELCLNSSPSHIHDCRFLPSWQPSQSKSEPKKLILIFLQIKSIIFTFMGNLTLYIQVKK